MAHFGWISERKFEDCGRPDRQAISTRPVSNTRPSFVASLISIPLDHGIEPCPSVLVDDRRPGRAVPSIYRSGGAS
jgi:hypothetical protein